MGLPCCPPKHLLSLHWGLCPLYFLWSKSVRKGNKPFGDVARGSVPSQYQRHPSTPSFGEQLLPLCCLFMSISMWVLWGFDEEMKGLGPRARCDQGYRQQEMPTQPGFMSPGEAMGVPPPRQLEVGRRDSIKAFPTLFQVLYPKSQVSVASPTMPATTDGLQSAALNPGLWYLTFPLQEEGHSVHSLPTSQTYTVSNFCLIFFGYRL